MKEIRELNPVECRAIIIAGYRMLENGHSYMISDLIRDFVEGSIDMEVEEDGRKESV